MQGLVNTTVWHGNGTRTMSCLRRIQKFPETTSLTALGHSVELLDIQPSPPCCDHDYGGSLSTNVCKGRYWSAGHTPPLLSRPQAAHHLLLHLRLSHHPQPAKRAMRPLPCAHISQEHPVSDIYGEPSTTISGKADRFCH
jgi:hypothetical protein